MPFKSRAQQRWMFAAESRGELPKGTALEWAHATQKLPGGFKKLPEHVKKKRPRPQKMTHQKAAEESVEAMFKAAGGLFYRNMEEPSQLTLMDSDTGEEALVPAMRTQEPRLLTSLFTGPGKDYESAAMAAVRAHQAKNPGGPPPTLQQIADIMGPDLRNKYPDRYYDPEKPLPDQTTMADYVVPGLGIAGGLIAARLLVKSLAHAARSAPAKPDSGMPNLPKPKSSPSLPELPSPPPYRAPIAAAPPIELPKTAGAQPGQGPAATPAAEAAVDHRLGGLESLLPALVLGAGGALYGVAKAPGGSRLRGAVIGGLGGAGAGAGFTAGHHLMNSKYAQPMASTGMGAAAMLGGAAAGGHLGLNAGRSLAHALHMGDDNDKVYNDLQEIDIMSDKSRVLPEYFRDYVHHKKAEASIDGLFKEAGYLQQGGRPKYKTTQPSRTTVSKGKSTIQHGSVKGQKTAGAGYNMTASAKIPATGEGMPDADTLAALAGLGLVVSPTVASAGGALYGAATAPRGRMLHGMSSAAEQAGGTAAGIGAGGIGGAVLGAYLAPEKHKALATLLGALGGGALGGLGGNYLSREMHPGPQQLGLGDREWYDKQAAWASLAKMASCGQLAGCVKRAWEPVSALNPENSVEAPVSALSPENVADEPVSALAPANVPPAAPPTPPPAAQPSWLGQHGLATGAGAAAGLGAAHLFNQMGSPDELDEDGQPRRSSLGVIPSALAAGVGGLGGAYLSGGLPGLSGLPNLSYDPKTAAWRALAKRTADTGLAALAAPASPAAVPGVKPVPAPVGTPKPSPIVPGAVKRELTGAELRAQQNPIKPVNPGEYSNATYGMNGLHPMTAGSGVAQPGFTGPVTDALKGAVKRELTGAELRAQQNQIKPVPQPVPDALNGRYTPTAPGTTKPDDPFLLQMGSQLREWDGLRSHGLANVGSGLPNVPHPMP